MLLKNLLTKNRGVMPTWNDHRFSNHLSMSLIALHKMGADEAKLQEFFDYSLKQYVKFPEPEKIKIDKSQWKAHFGEGDHLMIPYLEFFKEQKVEKGDLMSVIKEFLPGLIPGLAAHLFHGMIRLAFALEIEDEDDALFSLAYWASRYVHFPEPEGETKQTDETLKALQENRDIVASGLSNPISGHLPGISSKPEFQKILHPVELGPKDNPLKNVASAAIQTYASSESFFILHVVTGCYALRTLMHLLDPADQERAVSQMWVSACVIYIAAQCPAGMKNAPEKDLKSWDEIKKDIMGSYDDHEIKMVYACWREFQASGDKLYQYAAHEIANKIRGPGIMWGV